MLTGEGIIKKLYEYADQFETFYWKKNWRAAMNTYERAEHAALFCEIGMEERKKLFMNQRDDDDNGPPVWGAFNQDHVRRAWRECISKNETSDIKPDIRLAKPP